MAQLIPGKSVCTFCGNVILATDSFIGFPAFLQEYHPLWAFSDGVFHEQCFLAWPNHEKFLYLFRKWKDILKTRPKELKSPEELMSWHREAFKDFDAV